MHFDTPKDWDEFVTRATSVELIELLDELPVTDVGHYRRVCIEIALGDYQSALNLLETDPSPFQNYQHTGIHAFVRKRLGLKLQTESYEGPTTEDCIYWYLALAIEHASTNKEHANSLLNRASELAADFEMQNMLRTIQTMSENLDDPHLGLPLVAPPYSVLASPQEFDKLREDKHAFERLSALGQMYLDDLQKCRYAQYLLYKYKEKEALEIIEQANPEMFLLARVIKMKIFEVLEKFDELAKMIGGFKPGSSEPLEAEATILGYESCAFYFSVVAKDFQRGYAYLHRAQALALEHSLHYRLKVIQMHLEIVSNMAGDNLNLDPLHEADTGDFKSKRIRNRFDSLLRAGNLQEIESLVDNNSLSKEELFLAQATLEYGRFILGDGNLSLIAENITNREPKHPESRFYWALLMLQVFSYIGNGNGRTSPDRIYKVLEKAITEIDQLRSVSIVAANIYPLGLSIASKFHPDLRNADSKVALLWSEHHRDGLWRDGKKIVTITKPVREALILDEVYGTREHYEAAIHYQTGHPENKARLERSLSEVGLKRSEIATIGGVYRGLLRLGKTLNDKSILKESEKVFESSTFLQEHVVTSALNF